MMVNALIRSRQVRSDHIQLCQSSRHVLFLPLRRIKQFGLTRLGRRVHVSKLCFDRLDLTLEVFFPEDQLVKD